MNHSATKKKQPAKKTQQALWFIALLGLFLSCLALSWQLNAKANYFYSFWYQALDLQQQIDTFGPQNNFKHGFELLSKQERIDAFNAIVKAVHQSGEGLTQITYSVQGHSVRLLTSDEILHLQDVANLIDTLENAAWLVLSLSLFLLVVLYHWRSKPQLSQQLYGVLGLVIAATALVVLIGAKEVFYQFHIWIFPPGHPWFFYYQDSLMSTMMKAPDLFAGIAVFILLGGVGLFLLALYLLNRLLRPRNPL